MRDSTRYIILFCGFIETFVFTSNISGWTSLQYMLRAQGVYAHVCQEMKGTGNGTNSTMDMDMKNMVQHNIACEEQNRLLNLGYTIGCFCMGSTSFAGGFLLDKWGLRRMRLLINVLTSTGTILLSFIVQETSYLLYPALILMSLAMIPLRLANMEIANLFPEYRSTVITLYSGAFGASASVYVFMKYGFDAGLSWQWVCFILSGISFLMLPVTLFLLPVDRIQEPQEEKALTFKRTSKEISVISSNLEGTYKITDSPVQKKKDGGIKSKGHQNKTPVQKFVNDTTEPKLKSIPVKVSVFSASYNLHQYWYSWILLFTVIYIGTLHLWSERTLNDVQKSAWFSELYGVLQVTGLFCAPIGGVYMDWRARQLDSRKISDPEERMLQVVRSCFWPMFLTTSLAAMVQISKFFDNEIAIYLSLSGITLLRVFFLAFGTAYLRVRFPAEHFNKLLGIMSAVAGLSTIIQSPLFYWESSSPKNILHVNIFLSVFIGLAFLHPMLLLLTPYQKYSLRKEREAMQKCG